MGGLWHESWRPQLELVTLEELLGLEGPIDPWGFTDLGSVPLISIPSPIARPYSPIRNTGGGQEAGTGEKVGPQLQTSPPCPRSLANSL